MFLNEVEDCKFQNSQILYFRYHPQCCQNYTLCLRLSFIYADVNFMFCFIE